MRTLSPGVAEPLAILPENPRKLRLGRLTHCTDIANGWAVVLVFDRDGFEPPQKTRPFIPRHCGMTQIDDVVTFERRQWDRCDRLETQIFGKTPIGKCRSRQRPAVTNPRDPSC